MIVQNKYRSYTSSQGGFLTYMNFALYIVLLV
jgi:hypothetical protein